MCAEAARIGVMGGTFDPVHLGHLASAREIAEAFSLDRVLLVLAPRPPHKRGEDAAPVELRWQMLVLAVEEADRGEHSDATAASHASNELEACDIELRRSGPSWTVDTLRELRDLHPGGELFLILGSDAYEEIDTWSRPGELLAHANLIVTTRPGRAFPQGPLLPPVAARADARYDPDIGVYVHSSGHTISGHRIRGIEVSATDIRRRVRSGLPFHHLAGDPVARFINEHGLYGAHVSTTGADALVETKPADASVPTRGAQASVQLGEAKHCKH